MAETSKIETNPQDYEVVGDGKTVWVNGATGECIARFGQLGIDIHRPIDEQKEKGQCLFCTHDQTTNEDWDLFVEKVHEYFGIAVSVDLKPKRLQHGLIGGVPHRTK